MKKKFVAVARTLVLLVILGLVLVSTPFEVFGAGDTQVAVRTIRKLVQGTWLAIGWIALETAIAWVQALRKPKPVKVVKEKQPGAQSTEPPAAAAQ